MPIKKRKRKLKKDRQKWQHSLVYDLVTLVLHLVKNNNNNNKKILTSQIFKSELNM